MGGINHQKWMVYGIAAPTLSCFQEIVEMARLTKHVTDFAFSLAAWWQGSQGSPLFTNAWPCCAKASGPCSLT